MAKFPKVYVNVSGRKDFPFVVMRADGRCVGYARDQRTAQEMCRAAQ